MDGEHLRSRCSAQAESLPVGPELLRRAVDGVRGEQAQGRLRQHRTPAAWPARFAQCSLKKFSRATASKRDAVLKALAELRGNQRVTDQQPEGNFRLWKNTAAISRRWRGRED